MKPLNPTLWRTCKMLAGRQRIQLLRHLHEHPGRNVSELGRAVGIKRAFASQELRRIQSRGLLKAQRRGCPLIYRMETDPQVPSAAPLLRSIQTAFRTRPSLQDMEMCRIANGLAHERRIAIAKALLESPRSLTELLPLVNMPQPSLIRHLRIMEKSRILVRRQHQWSYSPLPHPLARTLTQLLRDR